MSNDKYVISPQKGPQTDFLKAEETYVFYGGGAGGGKTWAILADNLKYIHDPNYYSVYFR